jgi:D-glycero-beta-D-manno-heptose-7-phosphate kinase
MSMPRLDASRARTLVDRFATLNVLVVGDVMLDRFIVGRVSRISPEAPVPVVQFQTEYVRLGGAANVAHNIVALGGHVMLAGIVGRDGAAEQLRRLLAAAGVTVDGLVEDPRRRTTEKLRVVTERNQQVARIDYEEDADVAAGVERGIIDAIGRLGREADALLVSDYSKGVVTRPVVEALLALQRGAASADDSGRVPLVVDPKVPHLSSYAGATLVTPNHHEAETATHRRIRTDEDARDAARDFRRRIGCRAALVTRGEHGMWLSSDEVEEAIPAVAREVSDVTGAGDTVVAALSLALAAGASLLEAAVLANHAAGIVVGKFGAATVSRDELLRSFG